VPLEELKAEIEEKHLVVNRIRGEIGKVLVGQRELVDGLLMGIFTRGHILIEGVPGLAKTSAVKALADTVHADFKRIQFTPDLLPADLVGHRNLPPQDRRFQHQKRPVVQQHHPGRRNQPGALPRCSRRCWKPCRNAR
jgi:MoxR-like ATPase